MIGSHQHLFIHFNRYIRIIIFCTNYKIFKTANYQKQKVIAISLSNILKQALQNDKCIK